MEMVDFERILRVNTLGSAYVTRALLPGMKAAGGGRVLFTSSMAGQVCSLLSLSLSLSLRFEKFASSFVCPANFHLFNNFGGVSVLFLLSVCLSVFLSVYFCACLHSSPLSLFVSLPCSREPTGTPRTARPSSLWWAWHKHCRWRWVYRKHVEWAMQNNS